MRTLTRREMLIQAIVGGSMAGLGLSGCSKNQNAGAESPHHVEQINGRNTVMEKFVAEADNSFGINLLQEAWKEQPNANLFLSPLSIAQALQMTLNGAKGSTLEAMHKALALDKMHLEVLNSANGTMLLQLIDLNPKVQLKIANGIWSKGVQPDFEKSVQTYYKVEVGSLSGAPDNVNAWVKTKTEGKIDTLLKTLPPNTVAILANAAYFKGLWTIPFDKARTKDGMFQVNQGQSVSVPMMTQTGNFSYARFDGFEAIRLLYGSGRMSLLVLLPNEGRTITQMLPEMLMQRSFSKLSAQYGTISLPRFQIHYEANLKPALTALGMGIAFDIGKADFSGIASPSWISMVQHKTFLEVNEEGTEASAATGVVIQTKGAVIPSFDMRVNRPFCCAIQDEGTGVLLFLGVIVNPQA